MAFVDFPIRSQKDEIWRICRAKYDIDRSYRRPEDTHWTGAEIEHCCYLSALQNCTLRQAAKLIVPVSRVYGESIQKSREFASGKLIDVNTGKLFDANCLS